MLQIRILRKGIRSFSVEAVEKVKKKPKVKKEFKISDDVIKHFKSNNQKQILSQFPEKLQARKHKAPDSLYVADKNIAQSIAIHLTKGITKQTTLVEANPGPGLITTELVRLGASKILLFEPLDVFHPNLQELCSKHSKRVQLSNGDLINLWKLTFQDKYDNKSRVTNLLENIPKKEWTSDVNFRMFAGVGTINFFKHLINSIVFQTSLLSYGRCEMFIAMPPPLYIYLTCSKEAGYLLYRATTILFQIMFEHQFIGLYPRECFLPQQYDFNHEKCTKLSKINVVDTNYLYLVKITPRKNLLDLCPVENMQSLWYFIKQNCVSRRNRVIPNLEKWIPGCGPRLILNNEKSEVVKKLYDTTYLPKYTTESTTMTNKDYFPFMNIFTEFGDLTPSQMLSLFCQFRNWPEYQQSPFLASLENNLLKMETSSEESVDGVEIIEEDDNIPDDDQKGIKPDL